jgi:hypothetical protein
LFELFQVDFRILIGLHSNAVMVQKRHVTLSYNCQ